MKHVVPGKYKPRVLAVLAYLALAAVIGLAGFVLMQRMEWLGLTIAWLGAAMAVAAATIFGPTWYMQPTGASWWRLLGDIFERTSTWLCLYLVFAGTMWTIFYRQPWRWLGFVAVLAATGVLVATWFYRPRLAENVPFLTLGFIGACWCMALATIAGGDFRMLGVTGLSVVAIVLAAAIVHRIRKRRSQYQRTTPTN